MEKQAVSAFDLDTDPAMFVLRELPAPASELTLEELAQVKERTEETRELYRKALKAHIRVDDRQGMAEAYTMLGAMLHEIGEYSEALANYEYGLHYLGETGDHILRWLCSVRILRLGLDEGALNTIEQTWVHAYSIYS